MHTLLLGTTNSTDKSVYRTHRRQGSLNNMFEVTDELITYVCIQVYVGLSNLQNWDDEDKSHAGLNVNLGYLYDNLLKYLRATAGRSWRTSLTRWFKKEMFDEIKNKPIAPPPSDASSEGSELMLDIKMFADEESEEEGERGNRQATDGQTQTQDAPLNGSSDGPAGVDGAPGGPA
uniref:Uncharacterized protein n=1 Tax=Moniliophthora roreri TaxID=221103 RepID=A0A0W0FN38_MONRR